MLADGGELKACRSFASPAAVAFCTLDPIEGGRQLRRPYFRIVMGSTSASVTVESRRSSVIIMSSGASSRPNLTASPTISRRLLSLFHRPVKVLQVHAARTSSILLPVRNLKKNIGMPQYNRA
jgi:hypothetical protein